MHVYLPVSLSDLVAWFRVGRRTVSRVFHCEDGKIPQLLRRCLPAMEDEHSACVVQLDMAPAESEMVPFGHVHSVHPVCTSARMLLERRLPQGVHLGDPLWTDEDWAAEQQRRDALWAQDGAMALRALVGATPSVDELTALDGFMYGLAARQAGQHFGSSKAFFDALFTYVRYDPELRRLGRNPVGYIADAGRVLREIVDGDEAVLKPLRLVHGQAKATGWKALAEAHRELDSQSLPVRASALPVFFALQDLLQADEEWGESHERLVDDLRRAEMPNDVIATAADLVGAFFGYTPFAHAYMERQLTKATSAVPTDPAAALETEAASPAPHPQPETPSAFSAPPASPDPAPPETVVTPEPETQTQQEPAPEGAPRAASSAGTGDPVSEPSSPLPTGNQKRQAASGPPAGAAPRKKKTAATRTDKEVPGEAKPSKESATKNPPATQSSAPVQEMRGPIYSTSDLFSSVPPPEENPVAAEAMASPPAESEQPQPSGEAPSQRPKGSRGTADPVVPRDKKPRASRGKR